MSKSEDRRFLIQAKEIEKLPEQKIGILSLKSTYVP